MKAEVVLLIMNLSCSDPQMSFREFFVRFYLPPGASFRWGVTGELINGVVERQVDAGGDYVEYRVARAEKCGGAR